MATIDPVLRELAQRELARRSLTDFSAYVDPGFARVYRLPHLRVIASYLERAVADTLWDDVPGSGKKILVITTPPRHIKSSLISQKLIAWLVGLMRPDEKDLAEGVTTEWPELILTSYAADLATRNSRIALETVRDNPFYRNVFPDVQISRTRSSSEEWSLEGSPVTTCRASGVGGQLTGYGGIVVIDDPIKDRAQANSATYQKTLWDWWADVARTRINPGKFALWVLTRWGYNDPVGRLMQGQMEGANERIVYLRLPALAETDAERQSAAKMGLPYDAADPLGRAPGEALAPSLVSKAEHEATRRLYPVTHAALNQGVPVPEGGFVASGDSFVVLMQIPRTDVRWVLATDFAITEKETAPKSRPDPDYTVASLVGLWTPNGNQDDARLILAGMWRKQADPLAAKQLVKDSAREAVRILGARTLAIRSGQANADRLYLATLRGDSEMIGFSLGNLPRAKLAGDKMTQAQPWIEMLVAGRFYMVVGAFNDVVRKSVSEFPHGAHDDIEDTFSVAAAHFGMGQIRQTKPTSSHVDFYGNRR